MRVSRFLIFSKRESIKESLGFSSFELVFGHIPDGSLKLFKETWLTPENLYLNVQCLSSTMHNQLVTSHNNSVCNKEMA